MGTTEPTLLELLERAADTFEVHSHCADAPFSKGSYAAEAARLRAAAARIVSAMEHEQANAGVNEYHAGAADMLARINGGGPQGRRDG